MESIICNVSDMQGDQRQWLESNLGCQLRASQQVMILVLNPGVVPSEETRREALSEVHRISEKAANNLEDQGVSPEDADAAVDEAMEHLRRRSS